MNVMIVSIFQSVNKPVVVRYPDRYVVKTTLERFKTKTNDEKIIVESVEMEILWIR